MELHRNESTTAECIKEARAICSQVTLDDEALCFATVKAAKVAYIQTIKEAKTTHAYTIQEAEATCFVAIRDAKTWGPLRLNHSKSNMVKPSETWRNKSFKRKAEAKLNSSLPARLPYTPVQQSSKVCWWLLTTFLGGQTPMSHQFTLSQRALPAEEQSAPSAPPVPVPKQSPRPKRQHPSQILWTACLWVGPCPKQPQKGPPAPNSKMSYLGTRHSSRATWKHSAQTLTW